MLGYVPPSSLKRKKQVSQPSSTVAQEDPFKDRMQNYFNPQGDKSLSLFGTKEEQEGQMSGLELARLGYGQNLEQTGQDIASIRERLKERSTQGGMDPVSAAIRAGKSGAMSKMGSDLAAAGIKGAAAQAMLGSQERKQNADIARSLYGQQRQSIMDEKALASNTLSGTISMMQGERGVGTAAGAPLPPKPEGFFESIFGGLF